MCAVHRCPPSVAGSTASEWGAGGGASAVPASAMSGEAHTALLQAFLATTTELRDRVRAAAQ